MISVLKKPLMAAALVSTIATAAAPAQAQYRHYRHHHHGDDAGWAIGAGILGLGIGAAIASSDRGRYYDRGYYGRGYYGSYDPYYGGGYYGGYYGPSYYSRGYYDYGPRCFSRWRWDPYWRENVRVRVCR